tara:strand:- start:320 stop:595 length:276 start_codon:yes stop_codon:yes gene_type:complete
MAKKLQGDFFLLSANDLKSGQVLFYTNQGWSNDANLAIKIKREDLEKYEKIYIRDEFKCIIVSAKFVELDSSGKIRTLRDKIRKSGLTFKL